MPELPEVQTIVADLADRIVGRTITRVDLRRRDIVTPRDVDFPKLIRRRRITALSRRAKRIIFTLDDGRRFYIHLGMSGRLSLRDSGSGIRVWEKGTAPLSETRTPEPESRHTHMILTLDGGLQLHFTDPRRFGGIFWLGTESPEKDLGPEPLSLTARQLAVRLGKTARPIKSALLDQRLIAGLGNIYADESLHAAAIHPLTPANRLTPQQIARLNRAIKTTLRRAIHHRGSSVRNYRDGDGRGGHFQKLHRVYGRQGQPCLTCGTPIERIVLSGRSTCFCPQCQKRPRASRR